MLRDNSSRRGIIIIALTFLLLIAVPCSAAGKHLTIETIFSDPRLEGIAPSDIAWAPDSSQFAFLWNGEGKRTMSLWLYDLRSQKLSEILTEDAFRNGTREIPEEQRKRDETMGRRGSGINSFIWSPGSAQILVPYHSDIFLFDIQMKTLKRVTRTDKAELDPKFCGSQGRIAFVRGNDLWLMDLVKGETIQLTKTGSDTILNGLSDYIALEELSRLSSYEPSPDGSAIAYIQSDISPIRKLHIPDYIPRFVECDLQERPVAGEKNSVERIGVVPAGGGETTWIGIPLEDYYVVDVKWWGRNVLMRILERNNKVMHLYSYDVDSYALKELLKEKDDAFVNFHNNFIMEVEEPKGLLWTSEQSGFNHLYFYSAGKQDLRRLTEGRWEITDLCGVDKSNRIYYVSTEVEPEQRHLYSFDMADGKIVKLSEREGYHRIIFSPNMKYFVDLFDDAEHPLQLFLASVEQPHRMKKIIDSAPQELEAFEAPALEFFRITSRDGEQIHCSIMKPIDFSVKNKYPTIVHVHGGGYAQSVDKSWHGYYQLFHRFMVQELKFIVVDIDYRGSSGYGRKFRTDIYLHLGGKDLEDVEDAVHYLQKLPYIDPQRIGIWGWSYGGFMTNLAMLKTPDLFRAGAAVAPVNDWKNYDTQYTEERLTTPQDAPDAYRISSPITYAKDLKNHLLMIHGVKDDNVHFQDTVQLVNELIKYGKEFDLMIYPEGKHGIAGDPNRISLFKKISSHFQRYLK